jgi:hypothetical protein
MQRGNCDLSRYCRPTSAAFAAGRLKAQQLHQRVTAPEESKPRRRGTGRFAISNLRPILSLRF